MSLTAIESAPHKGGPPDAIAPRDFISSRAGYLPVSLEHSPIQALTGIPIYIRGNGSHEAAAKSTDSFTLFSAATVVFEEEARGRLLSHGVKFLYIPTSSHDRFRRQTELQIENIVADPKLAAEAKWAIVYETSNELASELLGQRNFAKNLPRLANVSRAVSSLVLNDRSAFAHLLAASHHDFYTATHMVNVGTWMVALAYAMGERDEPTLCSICQAGVLHDVGKTMVSKEILNKTGQLTDKEWASLRSHPAMGGDYLRRGGMTDPVVLAVAEQHHERLDGSGYPGRLRDDQIHHASRLCAVIDTFDAMTSLRPFKMRAVPVSQAMDVIFQESPERFDPRVVAAWLQLFQTVDPSLQTPVPCVKPESERRKAVRSEVECPVLVRIKPDGGRFEDSETIAGAANNISSDGLSMLMAIPVMPGQQLRLHLQIPRTAHIPRDHIALCVRCRTYDDGWFEIGVKFQPA